MTDSPLSAGPPPGWYADSPLSARERWWDGSAWTDHYRNATAPSEVAPPTRRAQRMGATAAQQVQMPPHVEAETARVSADAVAASTRRSSRPAAHAEAAASASPAGPAQVMAPASAPQIEPPTQPQPPTEPEPSLPVPRGTEPFPDQITGRITPDMAYRPPPPPVTYRPPQSVAFQPHAGAYVEGRSATLMPMSSKNGPAKVSAFLILLGLLAGAAASVVLPRVNPALVPVAEGITSALIVTAFILAIAGVVIAVSRPTSKGTAVFALVVSSLLVLALFALIGLRLADAAHVGADPVDSVIEGLSLALHALV